MPPTEFTPEVNQDFYNTLSRRISERGAVQSGQARSEALSRGLGGDPYEAAAVGSARQGTANELNSLDSSLAYNVAGLNRDERITNFNREDTQAFQAGESEKDRAFRERMATLQNGWAGDAANTENRRGMQAALWQIPLGGAAKGFGAWMGK